MTKASIESIRINVDPTNPGQFFACCGFLELAGRLWGGAEGWFEAGAFFLRTDPSGGRHGAMSSLLTAVSGAELLQVDPTDDFSSPLVVGGPFNLHLDWWTDTRGGGDRLKVWAGSMRSVRIAAAMRDALTRFDGSEEAILDYATVVTDPAEPEKKVEPYYFDSRRGSSAQSLDIGFSPDSLQLKTQAYPAVEFFCLVGLQRCRPLPEEARVFVYHTWCDPLPTTLLAPAVCGMLAHVAQRFRFRNAFRTDQKKHKAFTPATPIARRQT